MCICICAHILREVYLPAYLYPDGQGSFGLIEMDESASDVARGRIVLRNVAREAGIAMSTGQFPHKVYKLSYICSRSGQIHFETGNNNRSRI